MVSFNTYLEVYLDDLDKSVSLSEFERHFQTSHQTIKKHIYPLIKAKILLGKKSGRSLTFKLNTKNPLWREHLIICEKERLLNLLEKNILFNRLYVELSAYFPRIKLLLFGSAVDKKNFSDIDLLAIGREASLKQKTDNFSLTYAVNIHLIQTIEKEVTAALWEEIRKKHIIFNGHDHFIEVLYGHRMV